MAFFEADDRDEIVRLVADDVAAGLGGVFQPTEGGGLMPLDSLESLGAPIASDTHAALPWQWQGTHVGEIAGIPPTGREDVVVRGVTIVDRTGDDILFHRFIDWLDVLQQLGAVLVGRPVVASTEGLPGRDESLMLVSQRPDDSEAPDTDGAPEVDGAPGGSEASA